MKLTDMREMMLGLQDATSRLDKEDQTILQFMKSYFDQMFEVERDDARFHESKLADDPVSLLNHMEESVNRQLPIHERFWCSDADYYKPSGTSNNPKHNWSQIERIAILRTGDGQNPQFAFFYTYNDLMANSQYLKCFLLNVVDGSPRIAHFFY